MAKDLIDWKVQDDNGSVTKALLLNKHLPIEALCELARWARPYFGYFAKAICLRTDVPAQLLAECGRSNFSEDLCAVAEHSNTNSRTLLRLARVGDYTVVARALVHPSMPKEMIGRLAECPNDFTRVAIAHRTNDQNLLTRLSTDRNWVVRQEVVRNLSTPPEVVSKMGLMDADQNVVAEVVIAVTDPSLLDSIAERLPEWNCGRLARAIRDSPFSTDYAKTIAVLCHQVPPSFICAN